MYTLVSETRTDNAQLLLYDFEIRCDNGRLFPILGNWKPSRGRLQQLISPFENSLKYVKSMSVCLYYQRAVRSIGYLGERVH